MCGICGIVANDADPADEAAHLRRMCHSLAHRGPDDEGFYIDAPVFLGMRRLSIIDLTTGHQPMANENDTIQLVFNGEIYNYAELRDRLEQKGHRFRSTSDTEVIVHAYEEYGTECLRYFNGMFAIALWDNARKRLWLARDRLGIKPLYYWYDGGRLIFGSELKAVVTHPIVPRELDIVALDHFLTLEYIPAPRTIYRKVKKLPAGHQLVYENGVVQTHQYWNVPAQLAPKSESVCRETLVELLEDAVRLRLASDVPLGAFLSGGIDSSTIVAFMSQAVPEPAQTFSIGFEDSTYNELPDAQAIAIRFGTRHEAKMLQPDITSLAEKLVGHFDEPFGDFSIFPTYLVSQLASKTVKVVLSGDGGDELFGGYEAYAAQRLDRFYSLLPESLRAKTLPALMDRIPPRPAKRGLVNKAKRFVDGAALPATLQHTRWMMFITAKDKQQLYYSDVATTLNSGGVDEFIQQLFDTARQQDPLARQQYVDVKTYLAEDILTKVDRMSMATSVEARVPFLDHRLVSFALNLPPHLKLSRGNSKVILRQAMRNLLPDHVLKKPKQGFSIPLKHWLRGPLQPMMRDLLSEESVRKQGYFRPQAVAGWMDDHLTGRANHSHRLWALMVFELWRRSSLSRASLAR